VITIVNKEFLEPFSLSGSQAEFYFASGGVFWCGFAGAVGFRAGCAPHDGGQGVTQVAAGQVAVEADGGLGDGREAEVG
jgi:hypothetical protein